MKSAPSAPAAPPPPVELDFLPAWYPAALRWRRRIRIETAGCATILVVTAMYAAGGWLDVADASIAYGSLRRDLQQSRLEARQLEEKLGLRQELKVEEELAAAIGLPVEASRLLSALGQATPPGVAFMRLSVETRENGSAGSTLARLRRSLGGGGGFVGADRRWEVAVEGTAESYQAVTRMAAELNRHPAFDDVDLPRSDPAGDGTLAFEVRFVINLNHVALGG